MRHCGVEARGFVVGVVTWPGQGERQFEIEIDIEVAGDVGADTSISGRSMVRELAELMAKCGKPGMIVCDNGTELTSNAVLAGCGEIGIEWLTSRRASRPRTGFCENFNGQARDELLNGTLFLSLAHARVEIAASV